MQFSTQCFTRRLNCSSSNWRIQYSGSLAGFPTSVQVRITPWILMITFILCIYIAQHSLDTAKKTNKNSRVPVGALWMSAILININCCCEFPAGVNRLPESKLHVCSLKPQGAWETQVFHPSACSWTPSSSSTRGGNTWVSTKWGTLSQVGGHLNICSLIPALSLMYLWKSSIKANVTHWTLN